MSDIQKNKGTRQGKVVSNGLSSTERKRATSNSNNRKTRKRVSPFRIKPGCIVALRMKADGNKLTKISQDGQLKSVIFPDDTLVPVWTNPVRDRDEGLALVGKRIRCFLPKHLVEDKKNRVLEGEVVAIHEYMKRSRDKPWKVDLLVDNSMLYEFPFLVRTDEEVDLGNSPTEKARRNARLEQTLRGMKKCSVRIRLAQPGSVDGQSALKWIIQKIVPKRLLQQSTSSTNGVNGKIGKEKGDAFVKQGDRVEVELPKKKRKVDQNSVKYMGDRHDTPEQQIANWRWMTSRYHDQLLKTDELRSKAIDPQLFSLGFVGEVKEIKAMPTGSSSLAMVSVRRMILPGQTVCSHSEMFGRADLFDDHDSDGNLFQVPVEELVVLSSRVVRNPVVSTKRTSFEDQGVLGLSLLEFICNFKYSVKQNAFSPIELNGQTEDTMSTCHRCHKPVLRADASAECGGGNCSLTDIGERTLFCRKCSDITRICWSHHSSSFDSMPCYLGYCDCVPCRVRRSNDLSLAIAPFGVGTVVENGSIARIFYSAKEAMSSQEIVGFGLPESFFAWSTNPAPSAKPVTRSKTVGLKSSQGQFSGAKRKNGKISRASVTKESAHDDLEGTVKKQVEDFTVFKPTCARHLAYETIQSTKKEPFELFSVSKQDRKRNLREGREDNATALDVDAKTNQRAERAKQRRLLKGIAGFSSLDMDTLASREPQLRFGRSSIHAWGVFADKDISAGDMIVEYRGEIIENAMAEKREKEYETAKIGSDYMFRIDARFVCDATKVGNVARFINASCDPNCYTKIISVDGEKRIVIYAKKDISAGEELCYDYKFAHEYDPAKRIPCRCGASNCRGYMNWDKRYTTVTGTNAESKAILACEKHAT